MFDDEIIPVANDSVQADRLATESAVNYKMCPGILGQDPFLSWW